MIRAFVSSSCSNKCVYCNKKTSTYIRFGESTAIQLWLCGEHEKNFELIGEMGDKILDEFVNLKLIEIKKIVGVLIKHRRD